ncbi:MAG: hypothetical protein AB1806_06450 [Acidobacteriota bacterium]
MKRQSRFLQMVSRTLVAALVMTAIPLPVFAGEPTPPPPSRPTLTVLVQQAAAVTRIEPAREQTAGGTDKTQFASPSFFKKPAGVAVLVALAAGVGYAIYSTQHDRVSSPGKK